LVRKRKKHKGFCRFLHVSPENRFSGPNTGYILNLASYKIYLAGNRMMSLHLNHSFNLNFFPMKLFTSFSFAFLLLSAASAQNLSVSITSVNSCNYDGSVTAVPSGGSPPYSYFWRIYENQGVTLASNSQTVNNLAGGGSYYVTVTDNNGNSVTDTTKVDMPFVITPTTILSSACGGTGEISLSVQGGTGPYNYVWSIPGATGNTLSNLSPGSYSVTVSDAGNCIRRESYVVYSNSPVFYVADSIYPATCPAGNDGEITVKPWGGTAPYSYNWSNSSSTQTITGLASGTYRVTVTDANGCVYVHTSTVGSRAGFTVNFNVIPSSCKDEEGSLTANVTGGSAPYQYAWSTIPAQTGQTATGLSQGFYVVSITDSQGCSDMYFQSVSRVNPFNVSVTFTNPVCSSNGTATANASGGTAPYSYVWKDSNGFQNTQTATGLGKGYYTVTVTDANGCYQTADAFLTTTTTSPLQISSFVNDESCNNKDGSASLNVSGGSAPYSYAWSNGSTSSTSTGLSYGYYQVKVSDNSGCSKSTNIFVGKSNPVNISFTDVPPSCAMADGSLTANVSGGTGPYTFQWGNGQTTQTISNLPEGGYGITVKDAGTCESSSYFMLLEPSCIGTITGTVYDDANGNCIQDNGEYGLANVIVSLSNGHTSYTDLNGMFYFTVKSGSYTLTHTPPPHFTASCTSTYSITLASGATEVRDFANQASGTVNDLSVYSAYTTGRPGFDQYYYICYQNTGNTALNSSMTFTHDAKLSYMGSSPNAASYNPNIALFNLGVLKPSETGYAVVTTNIPASTPLGTQLCNSSEITPLSMDANPGDNQHSECNTVTGSYDPNFVEVSPAGSGPQGYIEEQDSILTYIIHFQNTGTDTAFTVMVKDTLDANLIVSSLEKGASSHPCRLDANNNVLTFTFNNILLPDSHINEKMSHGFAMYRIRVKPGLAPGTQIKATASIYFDYNVPVITNTTLNTKALPKNIHRPGQESGLQVLPNPVRSSALLRYEAYKAGKSYTVTVTDITGRIVKAMALENGEVLFQKNDLKPGMYFYQLEENSTGIAKGKLMVE
jgi:hypothetical protein